MRRKWEILLYLSLGTGLGLSITAFRNGIDFGGGPAEAAVVQTAGAKDQKGSAGVFSPPGTFEGGTVVPAPASRPSRARSAAPSANRPPTGRRWPRAPKGAPNVLYIVLDDVGFAALGCYGSPVCKTPHLDKLAKNGVRYNNFHTTALCSPSRSCFLTGPQSPLQRHGVHHRGLDRLPRLQRPRSARQRLAVGDADAVRLGGVRHRQMAPDAGRGHEPGLQSQVVAARSRLRSLLRLPGRRDRSVVSRG